MLEHGEHVVCEGRWTRAAPSCYKIELIGKACTINPDRGIFVTMNPGCAGRSNLPDNLKPIPSAIAMIKPDWELIATSSLLSRSLHSR